MHEYIAFLFFIYLLWKWSAIRLNLIFISVNLKSQKLSQPCNKRSQKLSLLNQPIYSVAPSIQREPGLDVDILKMPANLPSHSPDSRLCAHQRKPITSPHSMRCLLQKLLQGSQDFKKNWICIMSAHSPCTVYQGVLFFTPSLLKHIKVETLQKQRRAERCLSRASVSAHNPLGQFLRVLCACARHFPPLCGRFISSLFITITHPSTVNGTSGWGTSRSITRAHPPICPGNFPVPLRPNLPILHPLRLHLSVTDRANTEKQTAGLTYK